MMGEFRQFLDPRDFASFLVATCVNTHALEWITQKVLTKDEWVGLPITYQRNISEALVESDMLITLMTRISANPRSFLHVSRHFFENVEHHTFPNLYDHVLDAALKHDKVKWCADMFPIQNWSPFVHFPIDDYLKEKLELCCEEGSFKCAQYLSQCAIKLSLPIELDVDLIAGSGNVEFFKWAINIVGYNQCVANRVEYFWSAARNAHTEMVRYIALRFNVTLNCTSTYTNREDIDNDLYEIIVEQKNLQMFETLLPLGLTVFYGDYMGHVFQSSIAIL